MTADQQAMTDRELNLAIFERRPVNRVLWQPRVEPWFYWHKIMGSLPDRYADMTVRDFYDELGLSFRYFDYYTGNRGAVRQVWDEEPQRTVTEDGDRRTIVTHTPHGDLVEELHYTVDQTWRTVAFPVKDADTLRGLKWLLERGHKEFDAQAFRAGSDYVGDRGEPQFYVPKSPYQALAQQYMKLDDLVFALVDEPDLVEEVMECIDRSYDTLYEQICASGLVHILNFGENVHDHLLSPAYFKRYLVPFWERRCAQLHEAGIYSHMHLDGYFKSLLPYLADLPFDGIEALTPEPQGDVTLEQMRDAMGDKILLDGIPAIFFMPTFPLAAVQRCTEKLIEYFHPRLVLGISDEIPEGVDESGIEKIRWVGDYCRSL